MEVFGSDLFLDNGGVSFADWQPPHGVRYTWSIGQGQGRRTVSYESGGDIGDLMSMLVSGAAMGANTSMTYDQILTFRRLDQISDGFQAGNNANPYSSGNNSVNTGKKLNKRTNVSSKPSGDTIIYVRSSNKYILDTIPKDGMEYYYTKPVKK
jgi:hypothetical protein